MARFLAPLRTAAPGGFLLRNQRTGQVVAAEVLPALDSAARRRGLLGRDSLAGGTAMVIAPTNAVHTFFMRFPIDVAFVGKDGRVVKIRAGLRAWRMAGAWGAHAVVEMAAGSFARDRKSTRLNSSHRT